MRLEFGYEWKQVKILLFAFPLIAGIFVYQEQRFSWPSAIALLIIGFGMAIWRAWTIACVSISDSDIEIEFLVPFRRTLTYSRESIERYIEIAPSIRSKRVLVGGQIFSEGQDHLTLFASGTKRFDELSSALGQLSPSTTRTEASRSNRLPAPQSKPQ